MPTGCNEQKFSGFVPNIGVMEYLLATGRLTPERRDKGEKALKEGVENIKTNQITSGANNGAFSIWMKKYRDERDSDSVWLTAYVVKCFGKAKTWISVMDKYIVDGLNFLKRNQESTGKFKESGLVSYWNMQVGSSEGVPLTAFVTIAFLENTDHVKKYADVIKKALEYISDQVTSLDNDYALAIATYALALGKHPSADSSLTTLVSHSIERKDTMYWENPGVKTSSSQSNRRTTMEVEMAAYALMAFIKLDRKSEALPVVKWLVSQRNSQGGFYSTQDTVIGLQALSEAAILFYAEAVNMDIKLNVTFGPAESPMQRPEVGFKLDDNNRSKVQKTTFTSDVTKVSMNAKGSGIASVQVGWSYKTKKPENDETFILKVTDKSEDETKLKLTVCVKHKPLIKGQIGTDSSAMTVMEIQLPSGYKIDKSFDIQGSAKIKVG